MEKTLNVRKPLPLETIKRVEAVANICIAVGYVNREVLIEAFGLTALQASILLREFLQIHVHDIRLDANKLGYVLVNKHSNIH